MTARTPSLSAEPSSHRRAVATVAAVLVAVVYFTTLHLLIAGRTAPRLALTLVLLPWILAALARKRWRIVGLVAACVVGAILVRMDDPLAAQVEWLLLLENVTFLVALCAVFAASLGTGREALITMLARKVRGDAMPAAVVAYTRRATLAWALFFLACACASIALHAFAPVAIWSLFVNVLIWPAMAAMFLLEYAVRLRALPHLEHNSLTAGLKAYVDRDAAVRGHDDSR